MTKDYDWLCDFKGEDGLPFYIASYGEYAHCAELGRVNADDNLVPQSFAQVPISTHALAQVATRTNDYDWLCDVRGEDGLPFYIASYSEYAHCAELFRVNADDNLQEEGLPQSLAQYPITGAVVDDLGIPISDYREHAWTDEQYWASHEADWEAASPVGYEAVTD
jgi:hypothetical protein